MTNIAAAMAQSNSSTDAQARPRRESVDMRSVAPDLIEVAALSLLTTVGIIGVIKGGNFALLLNYVMPITLAAIIARGTLKMLRATRFALWAPLLWFRAAYFFYAAIGTLIVMFLNDAERTYIESSFAFFNSDIVKYNTVLAGFALAATASFAALANISQWLVTGRAIQGTSIGFENIGKLFLGAGLFTKIFFVIPFQFGFVQGTYSSIAHQFGQMLMVGIYLLTLNYCRANSFFRFFIYFLAGVIAIIGFLAMSKTEVVMPLMMVFVGRLQAKPSIRRIVAMVAILPAVLIMSAGPVDQGRWLMQVRYDSITAPVELEERIEMVSSYFDENQRLDDQGINFGLIRLSYVNVGSYVIDSYDRGISGNTFENALAVFIPRALWVDKPIITDVARELSYEMSGNWFNSVAPGLAPESYWNFGALGVMSIGAMLGFILFFWSSYAIAVQISGAWHLFPIVLIGAIVGFRLDGFFVVDVLGPISLAVVAHILLTIANSFVSSRFALGPTRK
ncbi:MAG: hypothetical protein ABGW84_10880 [Sphingomonadaceae bacterium]